jgi:hypothetical protein
MIATAQRVNRKPPEDLNIVRSRALIGETRQQADALRQEVTRSHRLIEEARKLLDATKPRKGKPD